MVEELRLKYLLLCTSKNYFDGRFVLNTQYVLMCGAAFKFAACPLLQRAQVDEIVLCLEHMLVSPHLTQM